MTDTNLIYTKNHPFISYVKQRYSLCKQGSKKNTQHVILDIEGSGIQYDVGDCVGVFPLNDPDLVNITLESLGKKGNETVVDSGGHPLTLKEYLTRQGNITQFSRKMLNEVAIRQPNSVKKEKIQHLFHENNKEELKKFFHNHEVWNVLADNPEVQWEPQEFCNLLMPLLPRLYSIASSQETVGNEVHLTVANLLYETNQHVRRGVCTHYLCDLAPVGEKSVRIYPHAHHGFTIPDNPSASLIMVGPGTGIAPYRGFLQARIQRKHTGRNWLFFGEWNRTTDYFYEEEWRQFQEKIPFRIETAFSRDQEHKIYVQHRMHEHGAELYSWLEHGAYFFVCGDASRMARDVDAALHEIIQSHGSKTFEEAKHYVKTLKHEKRYLRDVY